MEPILPTPQASGLRRYHIRMLIVAIIVVAGIFVYVSEPPTTFPKGVIFSVRPGEGLNTISKDLKAKHLIRSTIVLRAVLTLLDGEHRIVAGEYYLKEPVSVFTIATKLVTGKFDIADIRVTIPEGSSMRQIANILSPKLKNFSEVDFLKYSPEKEGYLFPDTYFFGLNADSADVIKEMQDNFNGKIKTVEPEMIAFGKPENDVITMASILEEEARTQEDWQIISGILWKRIKIGMPLQVDSTLGFVTGKPSSQLTVSDLKMDSPYNTYTNKGLPPTPIASPGLQTITAALTPTPTPYLYYLSDQNGVIHYAASFADHIRNREKYLK